LPIPLTIALVPERVNRIPAPPIS